MGRFRGTKEQEEAWDAGVTRFLKSEAGKRFMAERRAREKQIPPELLEKLAALEHDQWAHWVRYMLHNLTPRNIERWLRQISLPYADLTEAEKESDRIWARKMIEEILKHGT